jgi:multidrug efflux system membrane fusion protein
MNRKAFCSSLFILTGLFLLSSCSGEKRERPVVALPIEVATVVQKQVPVQFRTIGTVQAYSTVTVKSRVPGQIMRVSFKEGQDVTKGALLFISILVL